MISIKKFLGDRLESEPVLRRALGLLLQLIEIHAVEGDEVDYAQFRSGVHAIANRFSGGTPPEQVLIIVGEVATALKEYGERTTRYRKAQAAEYQRMVSMLAATIAATSDASDRTIGRLHDIEKKLERAAVIEDVRVLRMQLDECLASIREEIRCHENDSAAAADSGVAATAWQIPAATATSCPETDKATGLAGRAAAERALDDFRKSGGRWYAVAIVATRLASINSRFGYVIGDGVLKNLSETIQRGLSAEDRVFRWSGPCLLAILRRPASENDVRNEIKRIVSGHKEEMVEIGSRSVLLPNSATWAVFPSTEPARIICEKIDQFVASRAAAY